MTNICLSLSQHINSFLHPIGLRLSSKKQIFAKITTVALAAIFLVSNLHSVTGFCGSAGGDTACLLKCLRGCDDTPECSTDCHNKCCNKSTG